MNRLRFLVVMFTAGFLLSGCTLPSIPMNFDSLTSWATDDIASEPTAVEGKWVPLSEESRRIYYNEFKEGRFAAYTADGSNTLALGSYEATDTGAFIRYFSEAQKREVTGVCTLTTPNELSCVIGDNAPIVLRRDT